MAETNQSRERVLALARARQAQLRLRSQMTRAEAPSAQAAQEGAQAQENREALAAQGNSQPTAMDLMRQAQAQGQLPTQGTGQPVNPMDPVQGDPTAATNIAQRVEDNVVGTDDGRTSVGERVAALLNSGGESMTLGVAGDEAAGMFDQAIGRGDAGERTEFYREQQRTLREEAPGQAFAADLAGGLALPGSAGARFAAGGATRLAQAVRSGLVGAGAGGLYGFMEGDGSAQERLPDAGIGVVAGGLFGAIAPGVIDKLAGLPRGLGNLFRRAADEPRVEVLRAVKNRAYQAVDDAGETFTPQNMQALYERVSQEFADSNYVDDVDDASRAVLRTLENWQERPATLGQLDRIRQSFWNRYSRAGDQPRILDAIRAIDELIETTGATSDLMNAARLANSQYAKTQLLENAFERARDMAASAGSGGNVVNQYRQAVRRIINNPRTARFFSGDEVDVMREFVRGARSENMLRLFGKLSPTGNGLIAVLHALGGAATGGATLPLMAVGMGAKSAAENAAVRGAENLTRMTAGMATQAPRISGPANALAIGSIPGLLERLPQ